MTSLIILLVFYSFAIVLFLVLSKSSRKDGSTGNGWMFCSGVATGFLLIMLIHLLDSL